MTQIEIVYEGGSGIDNNVVNWYNGDDQNLIVEYEDGSTESYPLGRVVDYGDDIEGI